MDMTQAKLYVRSLSNTGARILLSFILARTALDVKELQDWTGAKRETIYNGLNALKSIGMVESQTLGHGRMVWLPAGDLLPGFSQMSEKGTPELQMSVSGTPALRGGRESIKLINKDSHTHHDMQMSEKRTPENEEPTADFPSVIQILKHTDLLFDGSIVFSSGLEDCEPLEVLAWCAYAYQQREHLSAPAGFVHNRLKKQDQELASWAKHSWQEVLPENYLELLGLIEYACDICSKTFAKRAELEAHRTEHPELLAICPTCQRKFETVEALEAHFEQKHEPRQIQPDESARSPIVMQLWQSVLEKLREDMPRASFDTWVRDTAPVRYDGNVLTIATRNSYARDWLKDRLTARINTILAKLSETPETPIVVSFVAAQGESV